MSTCNPVTFDGLSGSINITQKGSLGSICDAYYHKDIIANILLVSAITSQGHILADNTADSFSISHPGGSSIFTRRDNGLYVCNFGYPHVFVSTVSEMESQYTRREIIEARTARDLASPPDTKMIRALNEGTIKNTTATAEHVRRATSIHRPALVSIKGRTTRKRVSQSVRISNTDMQTMYIDIFLACILPYLITKVQPLDHIMTSLLPERSANAIRKAFLGHIGLIFTHNFYNITVCDYMSCSTLPSLSLREYNVGVC